MALRTTYIVATLSRPGGCYGVRHRSERQTDSGMKAVPTRSASADMRWFGLR